MTSSGRKFTRLWAGLLVAFATLLFLLIAVTRYIDSDRNVSRSQVPEVEDVPGGESGPSLAHGLIRELTRSEKTVHESDSRVSRRQISFIVVLDRTGPPLPGVLVVVYFQGDDGAIATTRVLSDHEGRVSVVLPAGATALAFDVLASSESPGGVCHWDSVGNPYSSSSYSEVSAAGLSADDLAGRAKNRTVDFLDMNREQYYLEIGMPTAVRGRVVDEASEPVASARVQCWDLASVETDRSSEIVEAFPRPPWLLDWLPTDAKLLRTPTVVYTNANGDFAMPRVSAYHVMMADCGGASSRVMTVCDMERNSREAFVQMTLQASITAEGVVTDAGVPLVGAVVRVSVSDAWPAVIEGKRLVYEGLSDGVGGFVIRDCPTGPCQLVVVGPSGRERWRGTVLCHEFLRIEVGSSGEKDMVGLVVDAAGRGIAGAEIAWEPRSSFEVIATTDADGNFFAQGVLITGDRIRVSCEGYVSSVIQLKPSAQDNSLIVGSVLLRTASAIVVDPHLRTLAGETQALLPSAGIRISLDARDDSGGWRTVGTRDVRPLSFDLGEDGVLRALVPKPDDTVVFGELLPGLYRVRSDVADYASEAIVVDMKSVARMEVTLELVERPTARVKLMFLGGIDFPDPKEHVTVLADGMVFSVEQSDRGICRTTAPVPCGPAVIRFDKEFGWRPRLGESDGQGAWAVEVDVAVGQAEVAIDVVRSKFP